MKLRTIAVAITLAVLMTALSVPSGASLLDIGTATIGSNSYNLIYDNNPSGSVVWLDYSNPANTWSNQGAWASSLNGAGVVTYNFLPGYSMNWGSGWQLPTTVDGLYVYGTNGSTTAGYNITSSQLGYLYYTQLGNLGYYDTSGNPQAGYGLLNTGPFANLQNNNVYWSGTEYSASPGNAWLFYTSTGYQSIVNENGGSLGLADRPGQLIETATAPEPSTMLLLGGGLAGLVGWRIRRRGC